MDTSDQPSADAPSLDAVLGALDRLQACLEREAWILVQPGTPDLAAIAAEKTHCLDALLPLDRALHVHAAEAETKDAKSLLRDWLLKQAPLPEVVHRMQSVLETCQRLNQRNGAVLLARQRQVALGLQALGVVSERPLYTSRGGVNLGRRGMTSVRV